MFCGYQVRVVAADKAAVNEAPIVSGGWEIATGFAASVPPSESAQFYAVYEGSAFGHPERGILAAIARGHAADGEAVKGAGDSAQLVVHSFAEGYFGARRTFGAKRAAQLALTSINAWLHGQIRDDSSRHLKPVSLTALLFYGSTVGVVQIGAMRGFRRRGNEITPLMGEHVRIAPDGTAEPTRAIGRDLELSIDYDELDSQPADRFLLAGGLESHGQIEPAFQLLLPASGDVSAVVLDVLAAPGRDPKARQVELADLPLRPAPREGDVWDDFVIGKTVYRGRYTILKLALDKRENRDVVLKSPLPSMLQDEVFSAGFMREAWIGSTVRGSNVARYIELPPERRSSLYLVMPYYRGETLEQRLNRPPPLPLPDGVGIALKLCEAVQDLAAIQIVHRDLKPENIMLLPNNKVKLLDLGLAYLPGIDLRDAVKPGGTLRYMAPELLKGVQANPRSEVYALGVTFYRMFAGGAYPFGQREGVPLQRMRPELPAWLGQIIQRAIASDPAERFADAGEMAKALHEGLVSGGGDAVKERRFPGLTKLQIWQALAGVFAVGFFILLVRALR
jgi:hypothetical protein